MPLKEILVTISRELDRLVMGVVVILLVAMVIVISAGVFCRYGLNAALSWSEEMGRFLLVWISFLGATLAAYRGNHIGIAIIFDRLSPQAQAWVAGFVDAVTVGFMVLLTYGGISILPFVHIRISPTLFLHMSVPYLIMPISTAVFGIHVLTRLIVGKPEEEIRK